MHLMARRFLKDDLVVDLSETIHNVIEPYSRFCQNMRALCSGSWPPPRIHFQPFPVSHHDGFTDGKHPKNAPWQMMLADDVVLCAREKCVLERQLEQWREALEKRGMKVSRAKTEYICLNGTPVGSVKMQSAQLPQAIDFKYLGSTLQNDGDIGT